MENISNKMGELIKINVDGKGRQTTNARELHEFLKVEQKFSDWIKKQLENVDAIENIDFRRFPFKKKGNNATLYEYEITLEIAKEICMICGIAPRTNEETKKLSKQARQYFIACEKKLKEQPKNLSPLDQLALQRDAILQVNEKQQQFESRLTKIENNSTIDYSQQEHLRELANKVVVQALGGNEAPAYKELGKKAFSSLWNEYKRVLKVNSYKNTLVKNYEKGIEFISNWKPTKELKYTIEGCNAQIRM